MESGNGRVKQYKHLRGSRSEICEEIQLTLEDLKPGKNLEILKKKTENVEERLLKSFTRSQAKMVEKRMRLKSLEGKDLTFVPEISRNSARIGVKRHNSEVKLMVQKEKKVFQVVSVDENEEVLVRPKNAIPGPDLDTIKESFKLNLARDGSCEEVRKCIKLTEMSLVDKNRYFRAKRAKEVVTAQKAKTEAMLKQCTFQPDLSKRSPHSKPLQSPQESSNFSPAPKPKNGKKFEIAKKKDSSLTYTELSPVRKIYSFKEGVNIKNLIQKSRPLLKYNVITQ